MAAERRPALLLDRDGVINVEVERLHRAQDVVILPGVAEVLTAANGWGVKVVVVTNQAGIGYGLYGEDAVHAVHARIAELVAPARVDGWYFCPHLPADACACRKPAPGMLRQAAEEHAIDLARSVLVGDKRCDLEAARAVGAAAILVRTGHGRREEQEIVAAGQGALFDACRDSLADAMPDLATRLGATLSNEASG